MKSYVFGLFVMALFCVSSALAENLEPKAGLRIGYLYTKSDPYVYSHNTHAGDSFLPNSSVPGSAGKTEIEGGLNFLEIGIDGYIPVTSEWAFNIGLGGLFGGTRDAHQNNNDQRDPASSASVYSEVKYGAVGSVGFGYYADWFTVGIEGREMMLYYESGWDRFGSDGRAHREFRWTPSFGPKIGFGDKDFGIEFTAFFSDGGFNSFGVQVVKKFQ